MTDLNRNQTAEWTDGQDFGYLLLAVGCLILAGLGSLPLLFATGQVITGVATFADVGIEFLGLAFAIAGIYGTRRIFETKRKALGLEKM